MAGKKKSFYKFTGEDVEFEVLHGSFLLAEDDKRKAGDSVYASELGETVDAAQKHVEAGLLRRKAAAGETK